MSEMFFVIKCFVATLLIVFLMQIRIGSVTLEQKSVNWIHESAAADELRAIAESAVKLARESYEWASEYFPQSNDVKRHSSKVRHVQQDEGDHESPRD